MCPLPRVWKWKKRVLVEEVNSQFNPLDSPTQVTALSTSIKSVPVWIWNVSSEGTMKNFNSFHDRVKTSAKHISEKEVFDPRLICVVGNL